MSNSPKQFFDLPNENQTLNITIVPTVKMRLEHFFYQFGDVDFENLKKALIEKLITLENSLIQNDEIFIVFKNIGMLFSVRLKSENFKNKLTTYVFDLVQIENTSYY